MGSVQECDQTMRDYFNQITKVSVSMTFSKMSTPKNSINQQWDASFLAQDYIYFLFGLTQRGCYLTSISEN